MIAYANRFAFQKLFSLVGSTRLQDVEIGALSGCFKDMGIGDKGLVATMGGLKSLYREGFFLQRQHEKTH